MHMGTNNAEKEGTSAIVGKYRRLEKALKETLIGHIVLSGILPVMGGSGQEYRDSRRMVSTHKYRRDVWRYGGGSGLRRQGDMTFS